jgi:hypothetical protein
MISEPSTPPSKIFNEKAQELAAALRAAFDAWVYRDATNEDEEIWIATDILLPGVFGFVAPMIVQTLDLDERGAETVTRRFAQHLDNAMQVRRVQYRRKGMKR